MYVETTLTYDESNESWNFPEDARINFAKANKICPQKDCARQFKEVTLWLMHVLRYDYLTENHNLLFCDNNVGS